MVRGLLAAVIVLVAALGSPARADWMFKRSNYSHSPQWGVETGPNRFVRGPYYTFPRGAYVRSGYRNLHGYGGYGWGGYGGGFYDNTNYLESWIQFGEQF